jgi:hypothetical protein
LPQVPPEGFDAGGYQLLDGDGNRHCKRLRDELANCTARSEHEYAPSLPRANEKHRSAVSDQGREPARSPGRFSRQMLRLMANDDALATSIALGSAAVAVGAAAANNGGGGYYPGGSSYGVAWDQFRNQYGFPTWRCRDRSNGQFVYDSYCAGLPMVDSTWPG